MAFGETARYARAMNRPSVIERAFQLAKSGQYSSVPEIRTRLRAEDYATADAVRGTALIARLSTLITASRTARQA